MYDLCVYVLDPVDGFKCFAYSYRLWCLAVLNIVDIT